MKIYILGLAGSGKTYLANKLSKGNIPRHTTDWLLYDRSNDDKKLKLTYEQYLSRIKNLVEESSWIIEGVHFFHEVADSADLIVFIDPPIYLSCFRILKRYFTDSDYRKVYSFSENLNLIKKSMVNYYSKPEEYLLNYPKYKNRKKYQLKLKDYSNKTRIITSNSGTNSLDDLLKI